MTRVEFTHNICQLIIEMFEAGEHPIIDFAKRSAEEQKRLFDAGLSKCDGISVISMHQIGRAIDIYFIEGGSLVDPKLGWKQWHDRWKYYGGREMIEWDAGHFEG